jgi:outer membrane protein assembly factor BamB
MSESKYCVGLVGAAVLLSLLSAHLLHAEDWPSWRGPSGTGVSTDNSIPIKWSDKENVLWRVALPDRGNSTPIVWGDRVMLTQGIEKDHRRTVMCFSKVDGKLLWQSGVNYADHEPTNNQNPYCSASPVTDGSRVIASFGSAGLYCYDMEGKELWHRDFGKVDSWHGSGSSPIIYGDLCILNFGPGSNSALVACNKQTGDVVWKVVLPKIAEPISPFVLFAARLATAATKQDSAASRVTGAKAAEGFANASRSVDIGGDGGTVGSWATPLVIRSGDHDELVVVHATAVTAYEPNTGEVIWTCKGMPPQVFASPAVGENILVALYGHATPSGTQITAIKLGGRGDVTATHILWTTKLPKDCVGSPIVADGHVYLATEHGIAVCLDLTSGEKKWEKRLAGSGAAPGCWSSLVRADDKLLISNQSSEVFVLKISPDFELLQTNSVGDEITCSSLAISNGQIFLRTYDALWCLNKPRQ